VGSQINHGVAYMDAAADTIGTIAFLTFQNGVLTNQGLAANELVYTDSSHNVNSLPAGNSGFILQSNGVGVAPSWIPFPTISLTSSQVSGVLPLSSGGTNATTFAQANGIAYINPTGTSIISSSQLIFNPTSGILQLPALPQSGFSTGSSQIVVVNSNLGTLTGAGTALGQANIILAGDFGNNPWQRGGAGGVVQPTFTFSGTASNYTADGVFWRQNGTGGITIAQSPGDVPPLSSTNYNTQASLKITPSSACSANSNGYFAATFFVEGYDFVPLSRTNMTFSVWLSLHAPSSLSFPLTVCITFRNQGLDRYYIHECTLPDANWHYFSIPIVNNYATGGSWNYLNGVGLEIDVVVLAGSGLQVNPTMADAWQTAPSPGPGSTPVSTTRQLSVFDTSAVLKIALPKLEPGLIATSYSYVSEQSLLTRCQRYYQKSYDQGTDPGTPQFGGPSTSALQFVWSQVSPQTFGIPVIFPTTMRTAPLSGNVHAYSVLQGIQNTIDYANDAVSPATAIPAFYNNVGQCGFEAACTPVSGPEAGNSFGISFQYSADASLYPS
jgi:hypothetical protein